MITVLNSKGIRVKWTIKKRPGMDAENFSLADVVVFAKGGFDENLVPDGGLGGGGDVYTLIPNSISGGVLDFSFGDGVVPAVGVYDLKAVWLKNGGGDRPFGGPFPIKRISSNQNWKLDSRCLMAAYVDGAFAITDVAEEETEPENDSPTIKVTSWAASYGYDGLSAYETAQLYGLTTALTEKEWVQMRASALEETHIADGAITTPKIADGAVTTDKISGSTGRVETPPAVVTAKIADEAVTTEKIADSNVTTLKIADGSVTTSKIADGAVTTAKIKDYIEELPVPTGVTTEKLADKAVTTAKLANQNVTTPKIADAAVTTEKLADGAVTRDKIAEHAVDDLYAAWADLMAQYRPIVINGNVENAPDEEDLTSVEGLLKFKGRPAVDGAKGLVWVRSKEDFKADLSDTIYVVRGLVSINSGNVTIGNNCTVLMAGGKLVDGSLTFGQGGVVASMYAYDYTEDFSFLGDFKDETVKSLQDQINAIVLDKASVSLKATPSVVLENTDSPTAVTLLAKTDTTASSIVIKRGDTVLATGSGLQLSFTDSINPTADGNVTYTAIFTISGLNKSITANVTAVRPLYIGAGTAYDSQSLTKETAARGVGSFNKVIQTASGDYLYFEVPDNMTITALAVVSSPADTPLGFAAITPSQREGYAVYRNNEPRGAGSYTYKITLAAH